MQTCCICQKPNISLKYQALTISKVNRIQTKFEVPQGVGCATFVLDRDLQNQLAPRALTGVFLGCDDNGIFKILLSGNRKIIYFWNVRFDEHSLPALNFSDCSSAQSDDSSDYCPEDDDKHGDISDDTDDISYEVSGTSDQSFYQEEEHPNIIDITNTNISTEQQNTLERPQHNSGAPERYIPTLQATTKESIILTAVTTSDEPSMSDIQRCTPAERRLWMKAIQEELDSLSSSQAWIKVDESSVDSHKLINMKVLPTHMVFKIKRNVNGQPIRFKARLVAGGHKQVASRDYDNVYTPVIGFNLFRMMMILAIKYNWATRHIDIKTAFLNGENDRDIYVRHPTNIPMEMRSSSRYLLLKSLYGVHQAPLKWFLKFKTTLQSLGYTQRKTEETIFIKEPHCNGNRSTVYILYTLMT